MTRELVPMGGQRGSDAQLIGVLAAGATQGEVARRCGVSERTVRRRLADPSFAAAVEQARRENLRAVSAALRVQAVQAVVTLGELLEGSQPPAVRLAAARAILDQGVRYHQAVDFEDRLIELEASVSPGAGATR